MKEMNRSLILACMFCFPNTGHVIILQGTVSLKFRLYHAAYVCIIYEKTMGQVSLSPLLGNKTYKLKRCIDKMKKTEKTLIMSVLMLITRF